jgi:hypothetical protein
MAPPARPPKTKPDVPSAPPADQSSFAPRLPTPTDDPKHPPGWAGGRASGQAGAHGNDSLKGNGSDLPQRPIKEPLDEAYPPKVRQAVDVFMANWMAKNMQKHLARFPFREMFEQHGIEGVRALYDRIAPLNRKIANICRMCVDQNEALDRDLERQQKRRPAETTGAV